MTTLYGTVEQRVQRGAKLLDKQFPDWYMTEIDWDVFNIMDPEVCLLGQLAKGGALGEYTPTSWGSPYGWATGQDSNNPNPVRKDPDNSWSSFGFAGYDDTEALKEAWKTEVESRLGTVIIREVEVGLRLNATEQALLIKLLLDHEQEVSAEIDKLKPQYREFLNPQKMTAHALLVEVRKQEVTS